MLHVKSLLTSPGIDMAAPPCALAMMAVWNAQYKESPNMPTLLEMAKVLVLHNKRGLYVVKDVAKTFRIYETGVK